MVGCLQTRSNPVTAGDRENSVQIWKKIDIAWYFVQSLCNFKSWIKPVRIVDISLPRFSGSLKTTTEVRNRRSEDKGGPNLEESKSKALRNLSRMCSKCSTLVLPERVTESPKSEASKS
ncbi:hypothetical protein BaOVIS_016990 [Babesia ovis]|uniref:Uncharacterized protein n=1 Tax=Babesia ovis TaxID=5869 RepID=A0A9W5TAA2_BABOV|nr:hypothetical protein BaOVIS_016990 [Babesia ovis]